MDHDLMTSRARIGLLVAITVLGAAACGDDADTKAETAGLPDTEVDLQAHEWVLQPDAGTPTIAGDTPVTLAFREERVDGQGPCNAFLGSVSYAGDQVEITDVATSLRACAPPVMAAEATWLAALEAVTTAELDDDADHLELTSGDDVRLVFEYFDADELLVGSWEVTGVNTGDAIVSMVVGTQPTLAFAEGGDLDLATGCGTVTGSWELGADALEVSDLSEISCEAEPDVVTQATALRDALARSARVEVSPGSLTILDEDDLIALTAVS
jgi:heat shock protein HslJ